MQHLEPRGETIFRLFFSLLQYAGAIAAIYLILGFLGVNTTLQLTSVGIISIAISLGSQNLTADIVAGIFIIFDGDFQVGDIIEVNGFRGVVKEIGVRSTKIIGLGDSLKIMSNKNVKDVLNLSKMNSWYALDVTVAADQPIDEIEKMLRQELPKIEESIPEIISGPYYKGVWEIISGPGGARIKLNILCECDIKMNRRVRRKLNGEVIRLFTEHGYKLS